MYIYYTYVDHGQISTLQADLTQYDYVMMPMIAHEHWTLMVADMRNNVMYLYNSLGPDEDLTCGYFAFWK